MNQTKKVTWLIAHEPVNLFLRTAQAFKEKIAELTDGKFQVEIYTVSEYESAFPNKKVKDSTLVFAGDPMSLLDSEDIQMSQLHITELARWHSPEFWALEMPFIFEDHDHATRVLEGDIGKKMLNDLVDKSPARGMAFTYSGGFRCVASETQIKNLNDFKGIKFAASRNPITIDMIESLGAIPEIFTIRDYANKDKIEGLKSVALDTTIPRYLAQLQGANKNFLTNTKHSLFLTSIIIGNKFWDKLSADEQVAFQEASLYASRLERKWSVEDAENFASKGDHSDIGVSYSEFDQEETEKFKALVEPLYSKYREFFYPGLIDGIIQS
jgi:TRAP-type C4-dicarboxylate transport system substrate-binding protein